MEGEVEKEMMVRKADIDTSAPFRSVKEAVMLFGERVLAGEIYANKLNQLHNRGNIEADQHVPPKLMAVELEETKQNLQKAKDEGMLMATCLSSLQQELERTKRELQQLKEQESNKQVIMEPEVDEDVIKHVKVDGIDTKSAIIIDDDQSNSTTHHHHHVEFQNKRYVTFADPQSLAKIMVPQTDAVVLERHPSLRKKKKKPLIPLIGGIFSRKKGNAY